MTALWCAVGLLTVFHAIAWIRIAHYTRRVTGELEVRLSFQETQVHTTLQACLETLRAVLLGR